MPIEKMSDDVLRASVAVRKLVNSDTEAARELGISRSTFQYRMEMARKRGVIPAREEPKPATANVSGRAIMDALVKAVGADAPAVEERDKSRPVIKNPMPQPGFVGGPKHTFDVDGNYQFTFGALGDCHLGSKYERLDVLESLYDAYEAEGITTVFNTGNWIDGEFRFNVHDIHQHGMDAQVRYLAKMYPARPGMTTYAVTGDDHEGWYAQRTGVNIGSYAEEAFRKAGRTDWVDLGYMDAPVRLQDPNTGKGSIISVVHPGGGSSYALSYAIQKIIEALEGGEKPAIGLYGHYHKLMSANIRNVFCVQTGAQKDVDTFARKMKLDIHVGGTIVRATMDPRTGAIVRCRVELLRYFNKGYYAGRWSPHAGVVLPERSLGGL
jgi:hypothetical protein